MQTRKFIISVATIFLISSFAFGQNENLKNTVNNLAFYNQKKDIKYLGLAKKSIDSLLKVTPDTLNLEITVYKTLVYSSILYLDSLNKLNSQKDLFSQTVSMVDKLSGRKQIYRFNEEFEYIKECLGNLYIKQGFVFLAKSDYLAALRKFQIAQNYIPNFKNLIGYLGYCNYKLGNFNTAGRLFNNLIGAQNTSDEYIEIASSIYKSLGDTTMALDILKKGRMLFPTNKLLIFNEANIYINKKDYSSLNALLPTLLDNYPNNADIAFVVGNCYDHLNKYDDAISYYLTYILLKMNLGLILICGKSEEISDEMVTHINSDSNRNTQSIDLNSTAYEPIFNLGLLFLKKSEFNLKKDNKQDLFQAKQWLEKANEIIPNDVKCLTALQMVYTKTGNQVDLQNINYKLKQINNQ